MKNFEEYLNEGVNNTKLVVDINDVISERIIKYMNDLEPELKNIASKIGVEFEKDLTNRIFRFKMMQFTGNNDIVFIANLGDRGHTQFKIIMTDRYNDVIENIETILDDIYNHICVNMVDLTPGGSIELYIHDHYIDHMISNDISYYQDLEMYFKVVYDENITKYISPKMKEKYAHIFKNELF